MKISIECNNEILILETQVQEIIKYVLSLNYLHNYPCYITKKHSLSSDFSAYLNICQAKKFSVEKLKRDPLLLKIKINWKEFNRSNLIENLLLQLLFVSNINSKIFPLHSSTVIKNKKAYLIAGATGSGKTNLSVLLCYEKKLKWASDDHINLTIKKGKIIGKGNDLISFRKSSFHQIKNFIPIKYREKILSSFSSGNCPYIKSNNFFRPESIGLSNAKLPYEIEKIFFTSTNDSYQCFRKLSKKHANTLIFNEFIKFINGIGTYILNNKGNIVSEPIFMRPKNGWDSVYRFINFLSDNYPVYIAQASFKKLISLIYAEIQK